MMASITLHETVLKDEVFDTPGKKTSSRQTGRETYSSQQVVVIKGMKCIRHFLSTLFLLPLIHLSLFFSYFTATTAGFDYRLLLVPSTLVSASKALVKSIPALVWYHAVKTLPTGIRYTLELQNNTVKPQEKAHFFL